MLVVWMERDCLLLLNSCRHSKCLPTFHACLWDFLNYINAAHETIKFMWNWSRERVNYLDVQVINNRGKIDTDLYTKPTDKHQYLFSTSCHPRGCKQSIPYAQTLRLRRICSTNEAFYKRCDELAKYLVERGYKEHFVKQQIQNTQFKTREEALTPRQQNTNFQSPHGGDISP